MQKTGLKYRQFIISFLLALIFPVLAQSQEYTNENLSEKLESYYDDQDIPESDSSRQAFLSMYEQLDESDRKRLSELLNFVSRKAKSKDVIANAQVIDLETADTINYDITLLIGILKTSRYYYKKSAAHFNAWFNKAFELTKEQGTTITDFSAFISRTYYLSKGYVYHSRLIRWETQSKNYRFEIDENNIFTVEIPKTRLRCIYDKTDTISINQSHIVFNPLSDEAQGSKGTVEWKDRYGPEFKDTRVELKDFTLNLRKSSYEAKDAALYSSTLLRGAMLGNFKDAASPWAVKTKLRPYFDSYEKDFELLSKNENFKYFGGVTVEGPKIQVTGNDKDPAVVQFYKDGRLFFQAEALKTQFNRADNASVKLYINENDSIYHPSAAFLLDEKELIVSRARTEKGKLNFRISDIKMATNMRSIRWQAGNDTLMFDNRHLDEFAKHENQKPVFSHSFTKESLRNQETEYFRSLNYFDRREFNKQKMYESRNPLFDIKRYCIKNNTRQFTANELASFLKKDPHALNKRLIRLSYDGYIDYNPDKRLAEVNRILFDHIDYFNKKKDHDVLQITASENSEPPGRFKAGYHLKQNTIIIYGAESVILSKRQRTAFRTNTSQKVVVQENRDMQFSGLFQSGFVKFAQGNYRFNYDDFTVKIDSAKKMYYSIVRGQSLDPVYSTIRDVQGIIYIDAPDNKSGNFSPEIKKAYPIFTSENKSYVYYNEGEESGDQQLANFDPEEFYFEIDEYTRDSLLMLSPNHISLKGKMYTGKMLPVFEDSLRVLYDIFQNQDGKDVEVASLGFVHEMEDNNVPIFEKGSLSKNAEGKSLIRLSRAGLKGEGRIAWLTSQIDADEFNFYTNSLTAEAANFRVTESENDKRYPILQAEKAIISWDVEKESITAENLREDDPPVKVYDGQVKVKGRMVYTPDSLSGSGKAHYQNSTLDADTIIFRQDAFYANNGTLQIVDDAGEQLFSAEQMKSYTDIEAEKTAFEKNGTESKASIKSESVTSYPDFMLWDYNTDKAEINKPLNRHSNSRISSADVLLDSTFMVDAAQFAPGSFYGSVDSLRMATSKDLLFFGENADFDGNSENFTIQEVKRIKVADIYVIPSSEVVIESGGTFEKLKNTRVEVLDTLTNVLLHEITDVDIEIDGINEYKASTGTYKYRGAGGYDQNIYFSKITYNKTSGSSEATGTIEQSREFMLNPYYQYKGDVKFDASKDFMAFDGFAKIQPFCNTEGDWFDFKNDIDPNNVLIRLSNLVRSDTSQNEAQVFADIKFVKNTNILKPFFLSTADDTRTQSVFSATKNGYATKYDAANNRYLAAPLTTFTDSLPLKNYMSYETDNCLIKTAGEMHYINFGEADFQAGGISEYDMRSKKFEMQTFTIMDFFFNETATALMAERINSQLPPKAIVNDERLQEKFTRSFGDELFDKFRQSLEPDASLPEPLDSRLVFSNISFEWDEEEGAFKSVGLADLLAVKGRNISQQVNAKIKVTKGLPHDVVRIYIEVNNNDWFYFRLSNTNLYAFSTIAEFNKAISDTKSRDRQDPDSRLKYHLTNENEVRSFESNY